MIEYFRITARTPYGDSQEYMFMGDLEDKNDRARLTQFMKECCDDCADKFYAPDSWDAQDWRDHTLATFEREWEE